MDLFNLRIVRVNPLQVFTLERFVSFVFRSHHITVFFTFPHQVICLCMFNLDLIINLSNYLANSLG